MTLSRDDVGRRPEAPDLRRALPRLDHDAPHALNRKRTWTWLFRPVRMDVDQKGNRMPTWTSFGIMCPARLLSPTSAVPEEDNEVGSVVSSERSTSVT